MEVIEKVADAGLEGDSLPGVVRVVEEMDAGLKGEAFEDGAVVFGAAIIDQKDGGNTGIEETGNEQFECG
jgi:hypothetical protein